MILLRLTGVQGIRSQQYVATVSQLNVEVDHIDPECASGTWRHSCRPACGPWPSGMPRSVLSTYCIWARQVDA